MHSIHPIGALIVCTLCVLTGPLSAALITLPEITVTSFAHQYNGSTPPDFLNGITDGVSFAGHQGTFTNSPFTGEFHSGDILRQHIVAPDGFKFSLVASPSLNNQSFGAQVDWSTLHPGSMVDSGPIAVTYENPQGTAPDPVYGQASVGPSGEIVSFEFHSPVLGNFSFTGLMMEFTIGASMLAGSHTFDLTSHFDPSFFSSGVGFKAANQTIFSIVPVPEPTGLMIAALSCLGLFARRRFQSGGRA